MTPVLADPIVFIGGGIGSITAIESLRERGYDGQIVLVTGEEHMPYDRPPLSKDVLLGKAPEGVLLRPKEFYATNDVELRLGARAAVLEPDSMTVVDEEGGRTRAGTIVLATGGEPRTLPLPGAEMDGVCVLRTLDDASDLGARLGPGVRLVVIGGGFIGTEVAAAGIIRGADVTLLEAQPMPLQAVLPELASYVVDHHRSRGVRIRTGVVVERFTGSGAVEGVRLSDGEIVPSDVVVVGVGMRPLDGLAAEAGLDVGNGVHVDRHGRTSHPHIYAIGDVANVADERGGRRRIEHWRAALDAGHALAGHLLGSEPGPVSVPWFWSDQFDLNIQMAGHPTAGDDRVIRGDPQELRSTVLFHRHGRLTGVAALNSGRNVRPATDLIRAGIEVPLPLLADMDTDLPKLAKSLLRELPPDRRRS